MSFFWRIFLSLWAIVLVTILLTFLAVGWLPDSNEGLDGKRFAEQLVNLVARDLRQQLGVDPTEAIDRFIKEQALDFSPVLQIYVLDPEGDDILGRALPEPVADIIKARHSFSEQGNGIELSPGIFVRFEGLNGFTVIGQEGFLPARRLFLKQGGRGLLVAFWIVVAAAVSFILARFIVVPVRRLRLAEQQVAAGDLSVRVAHTVGKRTDDIARLARDFDVMTERVDALMQSQQRLMRDVSHELRSPLARLQALLSIARQKADAEHAEQIDRMESELERLDELIGQILVFSRLEIQDAIVRRPTDIVDLARNIVDDASIEAQVAEKHIQMNGPERCVIDLDSGLVQSALENVLRNALRYTPPGMSVDVSILEDAHDIRVVVDDHGPGIPEDALESVFEPFYRVAAAEQSHSSGGGIGLAIAKRGIELHQGGITAENREGGGLRIEIVLPKDGPDRSSL
jgi:two-component system sensor histidine kinase CpxA